MKVGFVRRAMGAAFAVGLALSGQARADFVGDLANCAGSQIEVVTQAADPEKALKVAAFAVDYGQCIPRVVAVDPLLVGVSVGVAGLQSKKFLRADAEGCIDDSLGKASMPVAGALDVALSNAPGGGAILSSDARALLREIAEGKSNAALYDVPGFALVSETVVCGCAVASTGLQVDELKKEATTVLKGVEDCAAVIENLLGGAYEAGAQATKAVADAAKALYGSVAGALSSIGCSLGLGGCDEEGPPFFCTGYDNMRASGASAQSIKESFAGFTAFAGDSFLRQIEACDTAYEDRIRKKKIADAEAAEAKRLQGEIEKAEQLGSANALGFAFHWSPKCRKDAQCEKSVAALTEQFNAEIKSSDTLGPGGYATFGAAVAGLWEKYSGSAKVAVALAEPRVKKKLRNTRGASAEDRLWAYDCNAFLGRNRQSLCEAKEGFDVCKSYVNAKQWDLCALSGEKPAYFSLPSLAAQDLRNSGCLTADVSRTSVNWQCITKAARDRCSAYRRGGSSLTCKHEEGELKAFVGDALKRLQTPPPAEPPPATRTPPPPSAPATADPPVRPQDPPPPALPTIRRLPPAAPPAEEPAPEDEAPRG